MDDIIITGNKSSFVTSIIKLLGVDFDLKDLGLLHYFLGLQIDYTSSGLFVHQTKYATDLIKKFGMTDCKPCKTPSSLNSHLLPNDSLALDVQNIQIMRKKKELQRLTSSKHCRIED